MRKLSALLLILCSGVFGQSVAFPPGTSNGGGGSYTGPTITFLRQNSNPICTDGALSCVMPSLSTISTNGDAIGAVLEACLNTGCSASAAGCAMTASDGVNTYAALPTGNLNTYSIFPFVAANVTSGTRNLTFASPTCTIYYAALIFFEVHGANASVPLDSSVTNTTIGISNISITSAGNVTNTNELVVTAFNAKPTSFPTNSFICGVGIAICELLGPPTAAPVTFALTGTTGQGWTVSMMAFKP